MKKNFANILLKKYTKNSGSSEELSTEDIQVKNEGNGLERDDKTVSKKRTIHDSKKKVAPTKPKNELKEWIVVTGCYEKVLFGYSIVGLKKDTTNLSSADFYPVFEKVAHDGCVKGVSSFGDIVVSCSTDETIKIFNMYKREEVGSLLQHDGVVTCVECFQGTHMFSGSDDGSICIWRVRDWSCLLTLRGHKGGVLSVSVHPSGKLALSLSKDGTLKLWNLVKGRCAFTNPADKDSEKVSWSTDGQQYAILVNTNINIYSDKGAKISTLSHTKRVIAMRYLKSNILLSGGEDNSVTVWDTTTGKSLQTWEAHKNRVKDICKVPDVDNLIITIGSDGYLKLWKLDPEFATEPEMLTQTGTSARLTYVTCTHCRVKDEESVGDTTTVAEEEDDNEDEEAMKKVRFLDE